MAELVVASCTRQQRLIEALLDLVRGECGLTRREPVDVSVIAAEALRAHDLLGLRSLVTLEPARTIGDPDLLARLAANLVSNAIRHNVVGGGIGLATWAEPRRAVLSVTNTGPLVPDGELQRLFEPFQRLGSSTADTPEGAGLGLAVVQAIADAHDAVIAAQVRSCGGLRIDVGFPRAPRAHAGSRAATTR